MTELLHSATEGRTLQAERLRLGMTQQELADALGLHVMTVSKLERDQLLMKPWHWLALRGLREKKAS